MRVNEQIHFSWELLSNFDPSIWVDESREAIQAIAQQKVDGQEIVSPERPQPTGVVDLMEALKASVEATKAKRDQEAATG